MQYLLISCMAKTNTTWLQRSHYLHADFTVKPGGDSLVMLRKCVEYRLGQGMLEKTRLNTNTQKCEAANRSLLEIFLVGPTVQCITSTMVQGNQSLSSVKLSVLPFMEGRGFVKS